MGGEGKMDLSPEYEQKALFRTSEGKAGPRGRENAALFRTTRRESQM
jgi:hypothetical protein